MARKKKSSAPAKSWHGRLTESADEATAALLASLDVDTALWTYDIAGSLAHAQMLKEVKLISAAVHTAPSATGSRPSARRSPRARSTCPSSWKTSTWSSSRP